MSIIRNGNVALSNLRKLHVALSIFKKVSCRPVDFKKVLCRMSLRPKKGRVAVSILGVNWAFVWLAMRCMVSNAMSACLICLAP